MIKIYTTSRYKVNPKSLSESAQSYLDAREAGTYLVNIVVVGRRKMRAIAREYKHENVALPVLAFPYRDKTAHDTEQPLLGEIFICYPQAVLLAAEKDKTVQSMIESLTDHGIQNLLK